MTFKISVLVFLRNSAGELLLIQRRKAPNNGLWSPIGGKLEMAIGESPFECAVRETGEETGHAITHSDLHMFCMISEKSYEGNGHWLMFLFDCKKHINFIPEEINEGNFAFFPENEIDNLAIPETDREALWDIYRKHRHDFVALRADCSPGKPLQIIEEGRIGNPVSTE